MEQIDWSKAPADATHYMPDSEDWFECWVKRGHTMRVGFQTSWVADQNPASDKERAPYLIPRPITWNGTGLPPVGTRCIRESEGEGVVVAHVSKNGTTEAVIQCDKDWWIGRAGDFRPIRTPEQIAAEEREKAVAEMQRAVSADPQYGRKVCETLYDAGYRKTEPK